MATQLTKILTLSILVLGLSPAAVEAQISSAPVPMPDAIPVLVAAKDTPAGQFIQGVGNQAISIIADKELTPEERTAKYEQILRSAFDMQTIGHFVLGNHWASATPEQQAEYSRLFEGLMIKIYGDRLSFYSGERFEVKNVQPDPNTQDLIVSSEVAQPKGAQSTKIDWRVRQSEHNKLAVIDVSVEGVSQSVTQKQEYASILKNNGGNVDALLGMMRKRLDQASIKKPQPEETDVEPVAATNE